MIVLVHCSFDYMTVAKVTSCFGTTGSEVIVMIGVLALPVVGPDPETEPEEPLFFDLLLVLSP